MADAVDIMQFVTTLAVGGTERQFVNLVRGLDRARFRAHVGMLARHGQLLDELGRQHVDISEYRVRRLYGPATAGQQLRFARDLVRKRVRLIHTHGFYANAFALPPAWFARTSVRIASIRDGGAVWTPTQRAFDRAVCRLADCTVVNAESIRQRLLGEGWRPERIALIPNGIDVARFERPGPRAGLRHELGLPPTAPLVGVLARLSPCKGLEFFLEAARILAEGFPEVRFLVVGDEGALTEDGIRSGGPYRRELERHAERLGLKDRVVFAGFRLDVPEILAELAISVVPSVVGEGLPNAVLESMAAGLPVVATRAGGTVEAVEHGQTGVLVPPRNATALARAIVPLLADPVSRARMGEAGRKRVVERFSLERMTQDMQALYARLIAARERSANLEARVTAA